MDAGMQEVWKACLARLREAPDAALEWSRSGLGFLRTSIGSLPLFASTAVDAEAGNPERDETHYFLVPDASKEGEFVLVEKRRLPEGVGAVNSLPKVRVFHVHDPAGVKVLEERLVGKLALAGGAGFEEDLAARLETMGGEIDKQSNLVTGGLVVIGGVVAIANPLLGVAIAAKALVPEIGGKLAKFGLGAAADSVRRIGSSLREGSARKKAAAEVRRMKPELVIDPVLAFLDRVTAGKGSVDPVFAELQDLPEWWLDRDRRFAMAAVVEVWTDGPWAGWTRGVKSRLVSMEA